MYSVNYTNYAATMIMIPKVNFFDNMVFLNDFKKINFYDIYRLIIKILKVRSAGFEPAIPSLGSSYLNQAGPTSPKNKNIDQILVPIFLFKN